MFPPFGLLQVGGLLAVCLDRTLTQVLVPGGILFLLPYHASPLPTLSLVPKMHPQGQNPTSHHPESLGHLQVVKPFPGLLNGLARSSRKPHFPVTYCTAHLGRNPFPLTASATAAELQGQAKQVSAAFH